MNKYLSRVHTGREANMSDGSGKIRTLISQIHFVAKMNNRMHHESLTSSVKRAHKGNRDET